MNNKMMMEPDEGSWNDEIKFFFMLKEFNTVWRNQSRVAVELDCYQKNFQTRENIFNEAAIFEKKIISRGARELVEKILVG